MVRERHQDGGGTELGRFLYARRTQITPAEAGLSAGVGVRRTPGLRREEVAALAGVSIDYYTRLERGKETRPSPAVVNALARALKLDPDEHDLAALVGELLLKSPDFAKLWERYDVTTRTARRRRPSTIPTSARSPSASRACNWRAPPASAWASMSPNPAPPTTTP